MMKEIKQRAIRDFIFASTVDIALKRLRRYISKKKYFLTFYIQVYANLLCLHSRTS